jgi:hypothetical protein
MADKRVNVDNEKIQVTFNKSQLGLIDSFKGIFGNTRAEVVRYIVAHWLFEKGKR